ncbi:MAG: hypothetical protein MI717_09675 [Spirochaetales bacterium]|nr:hypothetical protein [Spirochaetales bacterium]
MPLRNRNKRCSKCGITHSEKGELCPSCKAQKPVSEWQKDKRRRYSSSEWKRIRANVLSEYDIPQDEWHLYAVDHRKPDGSGGYDPTWSTNHEDYVLVPMLLTDHNRKTANQDVFRDENGRFVGK